MANCSPVQFGLIVSASLDTAVAACAPGVGGEGHGAVMAGTAVFALGEGFHGEIGISLGFECFHVEELGVAQVAGQLFLFHVCLVGEEYGFERLGIDDLAAAFRALVGACAVCQG